MFRRADLIFLHAPSVYDFRKHSILYGPVSDLVPSTPVFEMYPIGFTTMAEYLERHGQRVRILNLAVRMLNDPNFDPEPVIAALNPAAFGIDLHWLPHAHGALAVAELVKRYHPDTPIIFGGFSATYFHEELIRYPFVDFVIRGDSAEEPLRQLMACLTGQRGASALRDVPNLTWKDREGTVQVNPHSYRPDNLDHVMLDYRYVVRAAARELDLSSYVPFKDWMDYPIMAALSCRGCTQSCVICGGSAAAFKEMHGRTKPAFRNPEMLAQDVRRISSMSRGPVFILGDLRQAGRGYAQRFFDAMQGFTGPAILELFSPASREFLQQMADAIPNFTLEVSLESHDPAVRYAFGKHYTNEPMERTIADALAVGAKRLDVFFMSGLPQQTAESVLGTIDYCEDLLRRFGKDGRLIPFISPLAPFLDPGSRGFENPDEHGYTLLAHTLEEHRRRLVAPTWKYVLNYETRWMSRDQLMDVTYAAGRRLNRIKADTGLVPVAQAAATEQRIDRAVVLNHEIDRLMAHATHAEFEAEMARLKPELEHVNMSTVCDKRELNVDMTGPRLNYGQVAQMLIQDTMRTLGQSLTAPFRRLAPVYVPPNS
ncbi:MAG: TIGR04190 family B12-binding domain/radical SAM domain protein [Chloroflexi bacterium]|nr:TIGR04190 family B12-binding domain/radical SAM domain protein [Chloroflexota bacterium]